MRIIGQVAQSVVSDFLTSPLTSASPTLDANVILDNLITSIREDMKKRWGDFKDKLDLFIIPLFIVAPSWAE